MDRRDPNNPPRPEMIWSDKHKLWMDPDTRTPEEKARHEEIADNIEGRAMALGIEHFICPECKWTHARADEDGCCTACGADCQFAPCACPPDVLERSEKYMQESMRKGLDPRVFDFDHINKIAAPMWRTWACTVHVGYDDMVGIMLPLSNEHVNRIKCGCMRPYNESARKIARQVFI